MNTIIRQLVNIYQPNHYQLLLIFPVLIHFINVHYVKEHRHQLSLFGYATGYISYTLFNYIDICTKDT